MLNMCVDDLTQSSSEHREALDCSGQCCFLRVWADLPSLCFSSVTQTAHTRTTVKWLEELGVWLFAQKSFEIQWNGIEVFR